MINQLLLEYSVKQNINLVELAHKILSGLPPLHIWGVLKKSKIKPNGYTAYAVNLQNGDKLFFEFHPDWILLYGTTENKIMINQLHRFLEENND